MATMRARDGVAHYSGLASCGSIWACPVCSAKIRNGRALEISTAAAAWHEAGNSVYMVTLTAPHDLGMPLRPLMGLIADSFRRVISGRAWGRTKRVASIVGTIRSVEVTHGDHGWHPHLHVLVFCAGDLDAAGLATMVLHFRTRWAEAITRAGYREPHPVHGVAVARCWSAAEAGSYIAKVQDGGSPGNELARADLKQGRQGGRTPFEILDDFRWTGDVEDLALWREYEHASHGRQAITWSKGLRALVGAEASPTDEELAEAEVGGDVVALFDADQWTAICQRPGLQAYLLDQYEAAGLAAVDAALSRYDIPPAIPPPRPRPDSP